MGALHLPRVLERGARELTVSRDVYAQRALSQVPRLLSLEDRNPFSRTYGCFNREYWLCRTLDFPSSIAQFGAQSLALAWSTPFPRNPFHQSPKVLDWTLAAIDYWIRIQKDDGSFDEFYPNERGWAGPTGFLVYAMCDSYRRVRAHVGADLDARFRRAVSRAGHFLARYDEPGVLANHHAMALLPIYEAYALLGDEDLKRGYAERRADFLSYCYDEGWCLEYDGADLGYLSATVSFLAKLQRLHADPEYDLVCRRAIEFAAHFAYPNGHFAGSMGSRQTLHFYPHGFEIYARQGNGLAAAVAERMLRGLDDGALVPPEIQEDRYFLYRIPELMESWIDYGGRPAALPALPADGPPFRRTWPGAQIHARKGRDAKGRDYYCVVNLAKGGVVKLFRSDTGALVENDCGFLAELDDGRVVTSQWIDADSRISADGRVLHGIGRSGPGDATAGDPALPGDELRVEGSAHFMVMKLFTPWTMIAFRLFMLLVGWQTRLAYEIKGGIRKLLMTRSGAGPVEFRRVIRFGESTLQIEDVIRTRGVTVRRLLLGDEFSVRYVPQSRYFQPQELGVRGHWFTESELGLLARARAVRVRRTIDFHGGLQSLTVEPFAEPAP